MTHGEYGPMDDLEVEQDVSSGAVGGVAFAATLTAMIGSFSIVAGLAAILDDNYMVNNRRYAFHLSVPAWGGSTWCWASHSSWSGSGFS